MCYGLNWSWELQRAWRTLLNFSTLYHTSILLITLQYFLSHFNTSYHTSILPITLQYFLSHFNTSYHTSILPIPLQYFLSHFNTSYHTSTLPITLQHFLSHFNTFYQTLILFIRLQASLTFLTSPALSGKHEYSFSGKWLKTLISALSLHNYAWIMILSGCPSYCGT